MILFDRLCFSLLVFSFVVNNCCLVFCPIIGSKLYILLFLLSSCIEVLIYIFYVNKEPVHIVFRVLDTVIRPPRLVVTCPVCTHIGVCLTKGELTEAN